MDKKGILYQGLPMPKEVYLADMMGEEQESFWHPKRDDREYLDVTYFVAYAMCKNRSCREALEGMEEKRKDILEERAEKCPIQSLYFWHYLGLSQEELQCARYVIGLLEELRYGTEEEEGAAGIGFWYLVCRGFHKECEAWKLREEGSGKIKIGLSGFFSPEFREKGEEVCSWLCMNLIIGENAGVKVTEDRGYCIFCKHLKKYCRIWGLYRRNRR